MTWYAKINRPSNDVILHLMDIATVGEDRPRLETADQVRVFLAAHPEIQAVNVYDSRFPRRPVPIAKFGPELIARLFRAPAPVK
jgi:hypothetical protein